jgi:hypothetical protein
LEARLDRQAADNRTFGGVLAVGILIGVFLVLVLVAVWTQLGL